MTRKVLVSLLAALSMGAAGMALGQGINVPANISAALTDKSRPAADVALDPLRKPAELLAFTGVKPGDKVVDFMMGGGYFTHLLAAAVGPRGHVWAYQSAEFIKGRPAYGTDQTAAVAPHANVTALASSLDNVGMPGGLDLVFTVQNYHDLHLPRFPADTAAGVNAQVFKALKPGGVYLVVDHAAAAGAPLATSDSLHRIDQAVVRREVEAAGFKLEAESAILANAADPRTVRVFDPSFRHNTDQFVMKFRKPR